MTKPGIIYRLTWLTVENITVVVNIYDKSVQIDSITGEEQIYLLSPSGHPLDIQVVDNNEDKFTPIRAKRAAITFLNDSNFNFTTFSTGEDDRFIVDITAGGIFIFRGFLEMNDIREPFLFQQNQEVTITAIDGLAFLKGKQLLDTKGGKFSGQNRLIDYIAGALLSTGLQLNINVFNNIREEANPGRWQTTALFTSPNTISVPTIYARYFKAGHALGISGSASNNGSKVISSVNEFLGLITMTGGITNESSGPTITFEDQTDGGCFYSTCFVNAKTFEDQIGTTLDCYEILSRILKRDSFVEQVLGEWYIFRVKELRNDFQQYRTQYQPDGSFNGFTSGYNLEKAIGLKDTAGTPFSGTPDAIAFFSKEQTTRTNARPVGEVKLTYRFEPPQELPCNVDLSRGDDLGGSFPDETIDGVVYNVKHFAIDDWDILKGSGGALGNPGVAGDYNAYMKKYFYFGYEKRRFMHLEHLNLSDDAQYRYVKSCAVPVEKNDKFTWSFDYRADIDLNNNTSVQVPIGAILLVGDDGTNWILGDDSGPIWKQSDATFSTNIDTYNWGFNPHDIDMTVWNSFSIDAPVVPVNGSLYFLLFTHRSTASQHQFDHQYSNLNLQYSPFIAGSYQKYTSQYNKTTRPGNYKSKLEDEVFISDSPKKLFKGALHIKNYNTNQYILAGLFYDGQEYLYANDGRNNVMSFGELQVRAVHNQYRNSNEIYELTAQGLNGSNCIDLIHRVFNRDLEPNTNNKAYQLVSLEQDWKNCEWRATMIKNFDNVIGYVKTDVGEFKYIQS